MTAVYIALNDVKLTFRNKVTAVLLLVMPVFMVFLMGYAMRPVFDVEKGIEQSQDLYRAEDEVVAGQFVRIEFAPLSPAQRLSSFQFFAASMLIFFLLTTGTGVGTGIISDRKSKTYLRISAFPVSKNQYLLGKALGNAAIAALQTIMVVMFTRFAFQVDWGTNWLGIGLTVLPVILVSSGIGVVSSSITDSEKGVTAALVAVFWFMTFISGGFTAFPIFESLAKFTVNHWAFDSLAKLMVGNPLRDIALHLTWLFGVGLVIWAAGVALYVRRVSHE